MNTKLVLTAFTMFAVIMGLSAMVSALAVEPPNPRNATTATPEITCEELEALLAESNATDTVKDKIRELAGCTA